MWPSAASPDCSPCVTPIEGLCDSCHDGSVVCNAARQVTALRLGWGSHVDVGLAQFAQLMRLEIYSTTLEALPADLGSLSLLEELQVYAPLTAFPDLSSLANLNMLIPDTVCPLKNLGYFVVSHNPLMTSIPSCLASVEVLWSYNNPIASVPILSKNPPLRELGIVRGKITENVQLSRIAGPPSYIDLSGNGITKVTSSAQITHLDVSNNRIRSGADISITGSKFLNVSGNPVNLGDGSAGQWTSFVSVLDISRTRTAQWSNLGDMSHLTELHADDLIVSDADVAQVSKYSALTTLSMQRNLLTRIPTCPSSLTSLDLSGNLINSTSGLQNLKLTYLDLSSNSLEKTPEIAALTTLTSLDLSHNHLDESSADVFKDLTKLQELDLSFNVMHSLPLSLIPSASNGPSQLRVLKASDNSIKKLSDLSGMKSLETLNVARNKLTSLPANFNLLASLKSLDLSGNYLSSFDVTYTGPGAKRSLRGLFNLQRLLTSLAPVNSLTKLVSLDVSSNGLSSLADNTVSSLSSLMDLDLSSNHLTSIPPFGAQGLNGLLRLALPSLRHLNLDHNSLEQAPSVSNPGLLTLDISNNRLVSFPDFGQKPGVSEKGLTYLRKLNVSGNLFETLPMSLSTLSKLQFIDVSGNRLGSLDSLFQSGTQMLALRHFDASRNALVTIPAAFYKGAANLENLSFANNKIQELSNDIGLFPILIRLDLAANRLSSLPTGLANLRLLKQLSLRGNQLGSSLQSFVFTGFNSIAFVDLAYTGLTFFPKISVPGGWNASLKLDLTGNALTSFPSLNKRASADLDYLKTLKSLLVAENKITDLKEIGNLASLLDLNLAGNGVPSIPTNSPLLTLSGMQNLNLGRNNITSLPDGIGQMGGLKSLDLGGNGLTSLPASIGSLSGLKSLSLGGNNLKTLPVELGKLKGLQSLDLAGNKLTSLIPLDLPALSDLDISGNDLSELPSLDLLTSLVSMKIAHNKLANVDVPRYATSLDYSHNALTTLPLGLCSTKGLRHLDVSSNALTVLGEAANCLSDITTLNLRINKLASLPSSLSLMSIESLDFSYNDITAIPEHLNTSFLSALDFSHNRLTSIPAGIRTSYLLQKLDLSYNNISGSVPGYILLPFLTRLRLDHNLFSGPLPSGLKETAFFEFDISDNFIEGVPQPLPTVSQICDLSNNCWASCKSVKSNCSCSRHPTGCPAVHGNGILEPGEQCELGGQGCDVLRGKCLAGWLAQSSSVDCVLPQAAATCSSAADATHCMPSDGCSWCQTLGKCLPKDSACYDCAQNNNEDDCLVYPCAWDAGSTKCRASLDKQCDPAGDLTCSECACPSAITPRTVCTANMSCVACRELNQAQCASVAQTTTCVWCGTLSTCNDLSVVCPETAPSSSQVVRASGSNTLPSLAAAVATVALAFH
eukprot:m51a1_g3229 hypothetical protein (1409) ;mRNA; f:92241-99014